MMVSHGTLSITQVTNSNTATLIMWVTSCAIELWPFTFVAHSLQKFNLVGYNRCWCICFGQLVTWPTLACCSNSSFIESHSCDGWKSTRWYFSFCARDEVVKSGNTLTRLHYYLCTGCTQINPSPSFVRCVPLHGTCFVGIKSILGTYDDVLYATI